MVSCVYQSSVRTDFSGMGSLQIHRLIGFFDLLQFKETDGTSEGDLMTSFQKQQKLWNFE